MEQFGKMLVLIGVSLALVGALLWAGGARGRGGLLPGDLAIERGPVKFYFPIVTCLVVSVVLTVVLRLFRK